DWNLHVVSALCRRAEDALAAGHRDEARGAAEEALARARTVGDNVGRARALHVLGLLDGSPDSVGRAAALLEDAGPLPAVWAVRIALARAALGAGDPLAATGHLQRVLDETPASANPRDRARAEATASHLLAE